MNLTEKLSNIQQKMKAPKNLKNSFGNYNYRNVEGILEAFKPFEAEFKVALTIMDSIEMLGDRVYIRATAILMDCESEEKISATAFAREAPAKKGMDDSQITGSTSSYARKYALNGLFLLDDTKDTDSDEYKNEPGCKDKAQNLPKWDDESKFEKLKEELNAVGKIKGVGMDFIKKKYPNITSIKELSELQLKAVIQDIKKLPDKAAS